MIAHNEQKQRFNLLTKDWEKCKEIAKFFRQFLWVLEFDKRGILLVKSCFVWTVKDTTNAVFFFVFFLLCVCDKNI